MYGSEQTVSAVWRWRAKLPRYVRRQTVGGPGPAQTVRMATPSPLPEDPASTVRNRLMEGLAARERRRLLAICEPIELLMSTVLCEPGDSIRHVYFPIRSFISLVAMADETHGVEVGMVGSESMLGAELALGMTIAPLHALVQGGGTCWRAGSAVFRRELARSPSLQRNVHRYLYVQMGQMAVSAGCLRFHLIGPRLARWLLMTHDRAHADSFRVTHEFLAYMLGVRRAGITLAASALQRSGLVHYRRGSFTVLQRAGLEAAACSCYAAARRAYGEVLS